MASGQKAQGAQRPHPPPPSALGKWGFRALIVAGLAALYTYMNSINVSCGPRPASMGDAPVLTHAQHIFYTMTPGQLHTSVLTALETAKMSGDAQNATIIVQSLIDQLVKDHPEANFCTDFQNPREWVFNNAGGAMGSMFIIHASITE